MIRLAAIVMLMLAGCGQPGERPYCGVCEATGLCVYTPEERQDAADRKASVWYTDPITISPIGD